MLDRGTQLETENEDWIALRFRPTRLPRLLPSPENLVPQPNGVVNNATLENGLNEFVDGIVQNNRRGPPPAPASAIEALPTLKIAQTLLHNTCPVCRYELQGIANNDLQDEHYGNDFCFEEVTNTLNLFWSHLTSYRPFRAFLDWVHRHLDFQENHTSESSSGWRWWRRSWLV
ncbi:E3 ubiquitin-protein ligase RING1-like [Quillaja saponaria]|uniref:E3 ubiquitin-protein ligase RING1-like n=1 Tax=Quillaja saponaria TaxID=32244 RepID=A0AAD7P910_QUISA|nr:E3 ubiquitin-protein ligase RING1-like [Quillaja saponaria]